MLSGACRGMLYDATSKLIGYYRNHATFPDLDFYFSFNGKNRNPKVFPLRTFF